MTVEEIRGKSENYDKFPAGMRVLAVDDDPTCLKLLDTLLRKCQYRVTTTNQARMALNMLREDRDRFDLVISDVHMPDMDGFKLLELVGLEMDLPVIMLSANNDQRLVMKGVTHGACDYLVKPVRIEELRNIWQHVIRRKKIDSNNQNISTDQVEDHQENREGHGSPLRGNADQNGKLNRKRKDEDGENEDNDQESEDPASQKKPRVVWSIELHRKFVAAVNQLGIEKAVPKRILDLMDVEGLTRENVASHLQKYRLYLKRISSASMVAAFGVKDSPFMRMASLDGFGDFRTLGGQGRLANVALTPYSSSGLLGRLNSPANVNLHNLSPSALIQPSHAPHLSNSINGLGKMHPVLSPASQNASLVQGGIPSSLEQHQLQQNKCTTGILNFNDVDDSRMFTAGPTFTDTGEVIGNLGNHLNRVPNNSIMLHGNGQQALSGGGFGNQSSLNMASFNSESFNAGVTNENWPNAVELSSIQPNSMLRTEPFHGQFPLNNSSNAPYLQNRPINLSSTTMTSVPLEDSRNEIQCQESLVGNVQNMNQAHNQRWGEQKQNYIHSSNNTFGSLNFRDPAGNDVYPLSHNLEQNSRPFNQKMGLFLNGRSSGGGASTLEQPKLRSGFVSQSYDALDDLMTAMIKREQDGTIATPDFGFDDYSFGQGI